jgi:GTPase
MSPRSANNLSTGVGIATTQAAPTALLVAVGLGIRKRNTDSLDELAALATSAGMRVDARVACQRPKPDPALFIGSGKADEIGLQIKELGIHTVIFDHGLSPTQHRNLERMWMIEVVDRSDLILEIFAGRARSHEGKLQVEVARLEHLTSRIVRGWSHLERQKGGIGLRGGPGEKQLELDRRMLETRLKGLKTKLAAVVRQRKTQRRSRAKADTFTVALVGYTNAGKSTLFNSLTAAGTYTADQLFATLDTLTRKIHLPQAQRDMAISDTVGFIRDLPHQLVAAFQATLDETAQADLLLHVVDASADNRDEQIEQVELVLAEIGAADVPCIQVFNKIDATGMDARIERDLHGSINRVFVSARDRTGLDLLRSALAEQATGPARGDVELPALAVFDPGTNNP